MWYVARTEEIKNAYKILVRKLGQRKIPFWKRRCTWENNIKMCI